MGYKHHFMLTLNLKPPFPVGDCSQWEIMARFSPNSNVSSLNTAGGQEKIVVETLCICGGL